MTSFDSLGTHEAEPLLTRVGFLAGQSRDWGWKDSPQGVQAKGSRTNLAWLGPALGLE